MSRYNYDVTFETLNGLNKPDLIDQAQAMHADLVTLETTFDHVLDSDAAREEEQEAKRIAAFLTITHDDVNYRVKTASFILDWKTYTAADLQTNAGLRATVVAAMPTFLEII